MLVAPRVTFIGDPTMGRRDADAVSPGILVRRAVRIGTAAIVFQDVEVGEEAVIGAAALVARRRAAAHGRGGRSGAPAARGRR